MAYTVAFSRRADRDDSDVPAGLLDALLTGPFPEGRRKPRGYDRLWRLRFGNSWRMVGPVDTKAEQVTIARVFPRKVASEHVLRGFR